MFVLYDTESGLFVDNTRWDPVTKCRRQVAAYQDARQYKRRHAAINEASLMNVNRNVPRGCTPNKYYQKRPQVQVHEIDAQGQVHKIYSAPPAYIYL